MSLRIKTSASEGSARGATRCPCHTAEAALSCPRSPPSAYALCTASTADRVTCTGRGGGATFQSIISNCCCSCWYPSIVFSLISQQSPSCHHFKPSPMLTNITVVSVDQLRCEMCIRCEQDGRNFLYGHVTSNDVPSLKTRG